MPKLIDLTGKTFGNSTVLRRSLTPKNPEKVYWVVQCKCGNIREIPGQKVKERMGFCKTCADKYRTIVLAQHGHARGTGATREYTSWVNMIQRCNNPRHPAYRNYGGRGIKVCERWRSFVNFLADMGRRPKGKTLDRYPDKNGNYEPLNCRWATWSQQQLNKRAYRAIENFPDTVFLAEAERRGFLLVRHDQVGIDSEGR